ncbi:MAG: VOC family protein [Rickettsiaceae bacterium]|nr:VOC family protein [Rickettsiaceae bacterium]
MFKPDNIPQLSLYLTVGDTEKSIAFYEDAFGFVLEKISRNEKGTVEHVSMRKQEVYLMFSPEGVYGSSNKTPKISGISPSSMFYVYCEDPDEIYGKAIKYGGESVMIPEDSFWGDRFCSVRDLDGYEWGFARVISMIKMEQVKCLFS